MNIEWTEEDDRAAKREGWAFFDTDVDETMPAQLQRLDDPAAEDWLGFDEPIFADDTEAWLFVMDKSIGGSPFHMKAILFIQQENPNEYRSMESWAREYYENMV